jgi:transposase
MAQSSPHQVMLSNEQRRELEGRAAAYSGAYRDVVRAKAILLAAEGLSNTEIAERLGQSRQAVSMWRNASARKGCRVLRRDRGRVARGVFPPAQVAEVKAMACELPVKTGVPLSRWSAAELAIEAVRRGIVARIAAVTIWRWLSEDAIRPWNYRSWIFPRDPQFAEKAGRILDLYEDGWQGKLLEPGEYVVCLR